VFVIIIMTIILPRNVLSLCQCNLVCETKAKFCLGTLCRRYCFRHSDRHNHREENNSSI